MSMQPSLPEPSPYQNPDKAVQYLSYPQLSPLFRRLDYVQINLVLEVCFENVHLERSGEEFAPYSPMEITMILRKIIARYGADQR